MTIHGARLLGRQRLAPSSPTPELDADVLLMHVLGCDRTRLLFHREEPLDAGQEQAFADCLARRQTGCPVAYITGHKEFYGYDFIVTPGVLIPKPDTELLVERALTIIEEKHAAHSGRGITLCDMCTGSGCVGLAILAACTDARLLPPGHAPALLLADISADALDVARQNRDRLLPAGTRERVRLVRSNLFEAVPGSFDLITANPPYIPAAEARALLADGRGEPLLALDGDIDPRGNATGQNDGLGVMRSLVPQAASRLAPGGVLLAEAGEYNAAQTEALFHSAGLRNTCIHRDMAGQLRVVEGRR